MRTIENSIASKHADEESDEAIWARQRRAAQRLLNGATFCPTCGRVPEYEGSSFGWLVSCGHCYDGPEGAITGTGETLALAVEHWNQAVEEATPGPEHVNAKG